MSADGYYSEVSWTVTLPQIKAATLRSINRLSDSFLHSHIFISNFSFASFTTILFSFLTFPKILFSKKLIGTLVTNAIAPPSTKGSMIPHIAFSTSSTTSNFHRATTRIAVNTISSRIFLQIFYLNPLSFSFFLNSPKIKASNFNASDISPCLCYIKKAS